MISIRFQHFKQTLTGMESDRENASKIVNAKHLCFFVLNLVVYSLKCGFRYIPNCDITSGGGEGAPPIRF